MQCLLDDGSLCSRTAAAHGLPHQAVIDINVRSHVTSTYV
jgi:hypothetical protein